MEPKFVKAAVELVQALSDRVGARVSTRKAFLVNENRINDAILRDLGERVSFGGEIRPVEQWETEGALWYKIVFRGDYEDLVAVRPTVEATFGDVFEYSVSSPHFFELQKKGCTKATGLRFVADRMTERLGHPVVTVAVGDQENDLPMLRAADIAACPANAVDAVKEVCSLHLCHHDEGCIGELIERLAK